LKISALPSSIFSVANYQLQIANPEMRLQAHKFRGTEAAEIAEAALVMPVVFIFLLGIIWFGRAFNIYCTITQAAQQGALVAARSTCASCAPPASPSNGTFPGNQAVFDAVSAVMQASSLDTSQIVATTGTPGLGCSSLNNIVVCREVVVSSSSGPSQICSAPQQSQVCGTTVSFQYPFQFYLPFTSLNLSRVVMNAQAQSRMEN
jgi:hypothetical protein